MAKCLTYKHLPTIALRGIVLFPGMRFQFEVGREKSVKAVDAAIKAENTIFLITQKDISVGDPKKSDLYDVGVVGIIRHVAKDDERGVYEVSVEARHRARPVKYIKMRPYIACDVEECLDLNLDLITEPMLEAAIRRVKDAFAEYADLSPLATDDLISNVLQTDDASTLADIITRSVVHKQEDRQKILSELIPMFRLESLYLILKRETEVLKFEITIENRTESQMEKNQKEYYLREKMKAIAHELGDGDDPLEEQQRYKERISALICDDSIKEKLFYECAKLGKLQPGSPDASVTRMYLDMALSIPFGVYTDDCYDIAKARQILNDEHYAMTKIKERFIEMLAVKSRTSNVKGQIICLVGPPGVGKTSIVRSVAQAMGRKYVRLSLGGVSDESEIRGHRKTYVGSMAGRIANALVQAKTMNPIILLDEIDKLGRDYKGDPASALLEVLDPEQNFTFRDNYLEFPLDLSKVLFITTANDASTIPGPLYDRMEIIELSSYTPEEKLMIAKNHLVRKQMKMHGLTGNNVRFSDKVLKFIIDRYTREAGVRKLEQVIAQVCRKCVVKLAEEDLGRITLNTKLITDFLGPEKYQSEDIYDENMVGVVNGLAWTSVGGTMLQLEAVTMPGEGKMILTGSLGDVMKESASIAMSYVRSIAYKYGIDPDDFKKHDIHIHAPEGAVPKDGPSAGVTMATAILSAFSNRKVERLIAMTGEISLTGRVMKIGGLKEKAMAAYKAGIKKIIIPKDNEADLWEVDDVIKENVEFVCVKALQDFFDLAIIGTTPKDGKTKLTFTQGNYQNKYNSNRRSADEI